MSEGSARVCTTHALHAAPLAPAKPAAAFPCEEPGVAADLTRGCSQYEGACLTHYLRLHIYGSITLSAALTALSKRRTRAQDVVLAVESRMSIVNNLTRNYA